jgi:ribosomal protein L7Ae-like RNA K-turn-binding protein
MNEKALGLLGLMRKAGMIELGEMNVGAAVHERRAKLLILASDAGENAKKRAEGFAGGHNVPLAALELSKDELSGCLGKANTVMAAITDFGFALSFLKILAEADGRYSEIYDTVSKRSERSAAGRKTGTGRNNA